MNFEGALIREQGVTFGVLVVRQHVMNDPAARDQARAFGQRAWGPVPMVLMAQDARGRPVYHGRDDLVRFLANLFIRQIPWRRWSVAA